MTFLRIIGVLLFVASGALFATSHYISTQVAEGQRQIDEGQKKIKKGQKKVNTMDSVFSLNPVSKEVGQMAITKPGQKKIDEGKQRIYEGKMEIARYSALIEPLQYGAIACFALGALLIIFGGRKKAV